MGIVEEVSKQVLKNLLSDFQERGLSAETLSTGYEGLSLSNLKTCCSKDGKTAVDFDLALNDLEPGGHPNPAM